jgi:TRAP-type mannitol/chloroaromatic compound transport system permease small subunit
MDCPFLYKKENLLNSKIKLLILLIQTIDTVNQMVGRFVAWLTVLLVVNVFIVVVLRYTFSIGWIWMQELYVWTHAVIFLLGAGYTLLHEGHVRIDIIYRDASILYKAIVNIFGCFFLAIPLLILLFDRSLPLIFRSWVNLEKSAEAGGMEGVFLLKTVIGVFAILFALQFLSMLLRNFLTLFGHEVPNIHQGHTSKDVAL